MNSKKIYPALLGLVFLIAPLLSAEKHYLPKSELDPISLLAPPPLPNSAEQAVDIASVVAVHKAAPPADIAAADSEKKIYVFTFTPIIGAFFQSNSLPKTAAFFQRLHYNISH